MKSEILADRMFLVAKAARDFVERHGELQPAFGVMFIEKDSPATLGEVVPLYYDDSYGQKAQEMNRLANIAKEREAAFVITAQEVYIAEVKKESEVKARVRDVPGRREAVFVVGFAEGLSYSLTYYFGRDDNNDPKFEEAIGLALPMQGISDPLAKLFNVENCETET